jgi:hypothetical protein
MKKPGMNKNTLKLTAEVAELAAAYITEKGLTPQEALAALSAVAVRVMAAIERNQVSQAQRWN